MAEKVSSQIAAITALVGIVGTLVTITNGCQNSRLESEKAAHQLYLADLEHRFKIRERLDKQSTELRSYLKEEGKGLFSDDQRERDKIRIVVSNSFPAEIVVPLLNQLAARAGSAAETSRIAEQQEAVVIKANAIAKFTATEPISLQVKDELYVPVGNKQFKIFSQCSSAVPTDTRQEIQGALEGLGAEVRPWEVKSTLPRVNEVRYFHESDKTRATSVKDALEEIGIQAKLRFLGHLRVQVGTIEIWIVGRGLPASSTG